LNLQHNNLIKDIISIKEMKQLKNKMLLRLTKVILLILPIFCFFAWLSVNYVVNNATQRNVANTQVQFETISSLQQNNIQFLKNITIQLSTESELQRYLIDKNELSKAFVLDNWIRASEETQWIAQTRFISASGLELLRIEYDAQKQFAAASSNLQNKKNRDYFKNSLPLKSGEVYISAIELNNEYGELSYPITPVLRLSTPVFHGSGQIAGILVVNVLADKLMSVANDVLKSMPGKTAIIDQQGHYLQGFEHLHNWSHILSTGSRNTFKDQEPIAWQYVQENKNGVISTDSGHYIFSSFGFKTESTPYTLIQKIQLQDIAPQYSAHLAKLYLLLAVLLVTLSLMLWIVYKRKLVQEFEHHSLELISALFYCEEAIFITDNKWQISVVNKGFCKATGYEAEQLSGLSCRDLYFMENADLQSDIEASIAKTGQWLGEVASRCKDGSKRTNIMFVSSVKNKLGSVSHYVLQMIDVTERKQMEEQLKVAAAAFNTRSAITITDAEGNIIKVNSAFTEITGYSEAEVLGKNPRILSSGAHEQPFYQQLWQSILDTGSWQGEIINKHKNGLTYPEWITISAVKNDKGKVNFYVATFEDIAQRKLLEAKVAELSLT